jgi:hypothetical protein
MFRFSWHSFRSLVRRRGRPQLHGYGSTRQRFRDTIQSLWQNVSAEDSVDDCGPVT